MTARDQDGKNQAQRGVQSIFTTHQSRDKNALPAVGLLAVGGGVSIWAWTVMNLNASNGANVSQSVASSALTFSSLGMLIVLAGMGLAVYSLGVRRTSWGRNERGPSPRSYTLDPGLTNELLKSTHRVSKTFVSAVIQFSVFVASYWSLVAEYDNNPRMQAWIQTNLPIAGGLLNYYGVVLVSGLLGVLVMQFLRRKPSPL